MKKVFGRFGFRKLLLAIVDVFIIIVAAIITDFLFSLAGQDVPSYGVLYSIILSVPLCLSGLIVFGAYNRLWRYLI